MPDSKGNPTETEIRNSIKKFLEWNKWFVVTMYQSALSYKGIGDLYAVSHNVNVWFEVKKPKGKQSQYQKDFERDIKEHGGNYFVVRSIDDVVNALKFIVNKNRI